MTKDLTTGKIMPILVKFTIPLVLGNLFQLTYNAVDSIIVGHFVGKEALAAVGICNPITTLMILFLNGLCMGAAILMGMQYGAKDYDTLHRQISTTMLSGVVFSVTLTVLCVIFAVPMLKLIQVDPSIMDLTAEYLRIIFWGLMFTFLYNFFSSTLRALGDSNSPLYFLIISASDAQLSCLLGNLLCQAVRIHRMDQYCVGQHLFYLVALQVPDHMKTGILRHFRVFFQNLLYLIFTKIPRAGLIRFFQHEKRFGLAHRDQGNLLRRTSCLFAGFLDILSHFVQMISYGVHDYASLFCSILCSVRSLLLVNQLAFVYGIGIQHNVIIYRKSVIGALPDRVVLIVGFNDLDLFKYGIALVNVIHALQGRALSNLIDRKSVV